MSVAPRLIHSTPAGPKAPYKASPLHRFLLNCQDHALDGVGAHSTAVVAWRNSREADRRHDAALDKALACMERGEYAMARHWVEQAQHHDAQEDGYSERVWSLFSSVADSCREIVRRIEVLFGRAK